MWSMKSQISHIIVLDISLVSVEFNPPVTIIACIHAIRFLKLLVVFFDINGSYIRLSMSVM